MIDYHVHTSLCYHASGTMEAYIRRAIEIGLSDICFLDHLTMQPAESNLSMAPGEIPLYLRALQLLKEKYEEVINVKIGLEIDFNPELVDFFQEIVGRFPFDVIGGALHFPGGRNIVSRSSAWRQGQADPDEVFGLYLEDLNNMLHYDYFDVVCHLDLIKKFGWKSAESFDKNFDGIIATIKSKDLAVEINTSGYNHVLQEPYPAQDIIKRCYAKGVKITLGSDAHRPADVGQHYDKALPMLMAAGYRRLATYTRRKIRMVPITNIADREKA